MGEYLLGSCLSPEFGLNFLLFTRLSTAHYFGVNWCAVVVRLCVSRALVKRSACPYMYRWVNIFARSVPVYALVDGYVGVCVYVFVCLCACQCICCCCCAYICTYIYLFIHPSIHTYMPPSRKLKLKIETIPKFKIQFPKLEIQNPISDLRLKLKLEFQNYFSKTYWQNSIYMV